jgi:hypothetical protein
VDVGTGTDWPQGKVGELAQIIYRVSGKVDGKSTRRMFRSDQAGKREAAAYEKT